MRIRVALFASLIASANLLTGTLLLAEDLDEIDKVQQQILQTDERLKALDAKIAESREQKLSLQAAVKAVQGRVGERKTRLQQLDQEILSYDSKLSTLETRVVQERVHLGTRKAELSAAIRHSQKLGSNAGLKMLLQHDDPALADRLNVYTEYVLAAQQLMITEQIRALEIIETAQAAALKDRNWLNYIQKKAKSQHDSFAAEQSDTNRNLTTVEQELADRIRTVSELKADQERLQTLMDELKAAQSARSGYFASNKGGYPLPVDGTIDARFGDVKSVGKVRWTGLFIKAREKLPVRAVADGEVVFSDWLRGFGMLVILDHGDGFMTLYGGNRKVTQEKGTWVEAGSTIATVGDAGGQRASGVYFEIRENAKPVDPEAWVSADNTVSSASQ